MLLSAALLCLAANIYHESRGEPLEGQIAVAYVTHNRAEKRGKEYCDIVYESKQFSWTLDPKKEIDKKSSEWIRAVNVALNFKRWGDLSRGATHFHHYSVRPKWRHNLVMATAIGSHFFYRER